MMDDILNFFVNIQFNEVASTFSIIGVFFGGFLTWWIWNLDRKRRNREEEFYVDQTKHNILEISHVYRDVTVISNGKDHGSWDEDEQEEITYQLKEFFTDNYSNIRYLIQNTELSISKWQSLSKKQQNQFQEIVSSLKWLIETYFPQNAGSISTHQRIWIQHFDDLHSKKNRIVELCVILY